jgi:hypothetical protein
MAASALKELHPADGEDNTGCNGRAEQAAAAARSCCLLLVGTKVVCALQAVREVIVKRGSGVVEWWRGDTLITTGTRYR